MLFLNTIKEEHSWHFRDKKKKKRELVELLYFILTGGMVLNSYILKAHVLIAFEVHAVQPCSGID